ncbi:IQ calmodulin-binding motif containing 1 (predicted), isoform CRA_d [Rattus norvegicus]|nr:IQ calmodulin-binding motif containing 1 (predicted), isoform CRA_d [Rattus norvegicus]
MSDVASRELHAQAQERLQHYFMGRAIEERAQQHREALMAQISTNIEQLMSMLYICLCFINGITHARDVASKIFRSATNSLYSSP